MGGDVVWTAFDVCVVPNGALSSCGSEAPDSQQPRQPNRLFLTQKTHGMGRPKKYEDFIVSAPYLKDAKHAPEIKRFYVSIRCPHCETDFKEVAASIITTQKANECLQHLRVCKAATASGVRAGNTQVASEGGTSIPVKKRTLAPPSMSEDDAPIPVKKRVPAPPSMSDDEEPVSVKKHAPTTPSASGVIVTIYALVLLATGRRVYVGQTGDPERRLHQHAARNSKCRLVRNAFRKHGRKAFALEPILRCRKTDADANESYWIIQGNTLYPNGYNLRHGSKAGEDDDGALSTALVPACTGIVPFTGAADEARACAEAWGDVAEMVDGIEGDRNDTDELCKDLLRDIHPDKRVDGRVYTPGEVSVMLNSIRETLV